MKHLVDPAVNEHNARGCGCAGGDAVLILSLPWSRARCKARANLCFLPLPSPPVDRGAGQTSAPQTGNCTPLLFSTDFKELCATAGLLLCSPPSPLFFCSTSIRLVLDCRASARRSLWSRGASQMLSRSPVETRIEESETQKG